MNVTCPINTTGYGVVGKNLAKELGKITDICLFSQELGYPEEYDKNAPSLRIYHEFQCAHHPSRGKWGAMPIYELNKLLKTAIFQLNQNDVVFQCSKWAVDIAIDNGVTATQVVAPLGVDTSIFFPSTTQKNDSLKFLNVGKWEIRKGHDILVEAFNAAFEQKDDVQLYLACFNPFVNNDWVEYVKNTKLGNKIIPVMPFETQAEIASLMNFCDVGVFPFRAEGWNLELLEMMACGKPVIATNYSGATEFLSEDNATLLNPNGLELAFDGKWFHGQGSWAQLGKDYFDALVNALRTANRTTNNGGLETAKRFSWANSAQIILEEMRG